MQKHLATLASEPLQTSWRKTVTERDNTPSPQPSELFSPQEWQGLGRSLSLSSRELQIVRHVFSDHKEEHIAHKLGISPHTVHTYFTRIYHKLRVNSRVQMVVRVFAESRRLDDNEPPANRLPRDGRGLPAEVEEEGVGGVERRSLGRHAPPCPSRG